MVNKQPYRIKMISEYHKIMDLPKPEHPLISLINLELLTHFPISNEQCLFFTNLITLNIIFRVSKCLKPDLFTNHHAFDRQTSDFYF